MNAYNNKNRSEYRDLDDLVSSRYIWIPKMLLLKSNYEEK
jgi:hypothetical protein